MSDTAAPAEERTQLKPFAQFVQEQRNGDLHDTLSTALAELVASCAETGKKGTLTLKVTVASNKDDTTVLVTDDVTVKAPKPDAKPAVFFYDADGNLNRRNPTQPELPLREVPGGKTDTPREIREATGA